MLPLTDLQADLLFRILDGGNDAPRFRVAHADYLDVLDQLEQQGLLLRAENEYTPSLLAVADLRSKHVVEADSIINRCARLMGALQRLYRRAPGQQIAVGDLAVEAEAPEPQVLRVLPYLLQTPLCTVAETVNGVVVSIMPTESLIRLKDFPSVLAYVRDQYEQRKKPPVPAASARPKDQKFGILDSPALLAADLARLSGTLGRAVLYIDLDRFKALNTEFTETVVDQLILQPLQRLEVECAQGHGHVYAEGGDETVIVLPNFSEQMARAFATELHARIAALQFGGEAQSKRVTASIGLAHGDHTVDGGLLKQRANDAKRRAKDAGRNRIVVWGPDK